MRGRSGGIPVQDGTDVIAVAGEADALLVQWAPITGEVIEHLQNCKVIVRYGIGLDNIDLEAARARSIAVRNIPDYCIEEVADHSFSLALALARQLTQIDRQVRDGKWSIIPLRPMPAFRQSTFVTIGYGRIARAVLHRARACGFQLAACDPYLSPEFEFPADVTRVNFEEALRIADILSERAADQRNPPYARTGDPERDETDIAVDQHRPRRLNRYGGVGRCAR